MRLQPNQSTTYVSEKNAEISLKYSYPGLWIFKALLCNMGTIHKAKLGHNCSRNHESMADVRP